MEVGHRNPPPLSKVDYKQLRKINPEEGEERCRRIPKDERVYVLDCQVKDIELRLERLYHALETGKFAID